MARLHSVGFELAGTVANIPTGMEVYTYLGNGLSDFTIQSSVVRSGTYALRATDFTSVTQSRARFRFLNTASAGPIFSRVYVRFAEFPLVAMRFMVLEGAAEYLWATIDASGTLALVDEDGSIGSSASNLSLDTWYRIEMHFDGTGGVNGDTARLLVDGVEVVGSTTRNIAGTVAILGIGGNLATTEVNTFGDIYFDDIAVNDSTGSAQTSFPGDGKIVHLWPDGDGDGDTVVTRSGAGTTPTGTDRGANWQQLGSAFDKPTPNDQTDFLLLTGTTSEVLVACESAATAGIGASDTISVVQVGGRIAGVTTSGATWIPRIMSQSAGTKVSGATVSFGATIWFTHDDGTDVTQYKLTSYLDPQAGGAWTPALLDTMQIGAATADGNPDTLVTALWALVEYVPVVAAAFMPRKPFVINQTVNRAGTY